MVTEIMMMENQQDWLLDSGATCHVTLFRRAFTNYEEFEEAKIVYMGNSYISEVVGKESVKLSLISG